MSDPSTASTPSTQWDPDDPLARMPGETGRQNAALHDYAAMGAGRSLASLERRYQDQRRTGGAPKPPSTSLTTIKKWSTTNDWQARITAWTAHQTEQERRTWEERSRAWREQAWDLGQDIRAVVAETFREQAPRLIRSSRREMRQPDGSTREIVTVGLDANAAARLVDAMIKAADAGLETHRQAAGTEEDPVHTVALSLADWRAQQAERRAAAMETLAEFGDRT